MTISTHIEEYFAGDYSDIKEVPENKTICPVKYEHQYHIGFFNGIKWEEKATEEEIEILKQKDKLINLQQFLVNKKSDGEIYYNEIELALTILLAGLPIVQLIPIVEEIETKIKPIINEIKTGDWFNAYMRLWVTEDYTRPTSVLLTQTFDQVKVRVKQYFETNYPR